MLIRDLVYMDQYGAFRSDVQLSDYDNPSLNLELLKNYIFTVSAPATSQAGRDFAAKNVLDKLKEAFSIKRAGSDLNRIVLTANYGRGKSHLALVLANLFSRPADSEEVQIIFDRLGHALNNPTQLNGYREFKQSKGEFLVIRLRGDAISDLQEGFLRALEQALEEHDSTRRIIPPFWYTQAEKWLNAQSQETLQKIDEYLKKEHTDLAILRQDLQKSGSYELIREAIKYAIGVYPDFGHELNLTELIDWAVKEVCVPNHLGGVLILFDEFSLFLQKYATARTPGKLQELLNGISNHPGESAFLAFTQLDIESVVDTYAYGNRREDIRRELDRLPRDKRARLFSLMEGVLDAYLKQDEAAWNTWWDKNHKVRPTMVRNLDTLLTYFPKRYSHTLQWDYDRVEKVVVRGCYPLHPLTTAILSTHTFEAGVGENARTALHFVRDRWEKGLPNQPAEREDGTPNFIFAIELVDFFGEQISKKWHQAYQEALENPRMQLNEEHQAVLKALLLQHAVGELEKVRNQRDQRELLSALSGISETQVASLLDELARNQVIQRNYSIYSLFPAGYRSPEAEKIIEEAAQKTPVDRTLLKEIAEEIPVCELTLGFGNSRDWAPCQMVLTKEDFNEKTLRELTSQYRIGNGIEGSPRGVIIWLLARSEEEKIWFRQQAQTLLDSVLGTTNFYPLPVLIILPKRANPDLLNAAQRRKALASLDQSKREEIGSILWNNEKRRAETDIRTGIFHLLGDLDHYLDVNRQLHEYALPRVYMASVQTLGRHSIKEVLAACYRQAYPYRVEFSDKPVLTKGPNHLRTAVENISRALFEDAVGPSIRNLKNQDMQYNIAVNFLANKWGLLNAQNNFIIQPPTSRAPREAWNRLENVFSPGSGETSAKNVLVELLNPPYGHDYNTLTLLLAAWIGFHRYEIQLSLNGRIQSLEQLKEVLTAPKDFLDTLVTQGFTIRRIDIEEQFKEINTIIERIEKKGSPFSIDEAHQAISKLNQAQSYPHLPENRRELIKSRRSLLEQELAKAQEYDQQIRQWNSQLQLANFEQLLEMRDRLREFSAPDLVTPLEPDVNILRSNWEKRLEQTLDIYCVQHSQLTDVSHYKANEDKLRKVLEKLTEYPILANKVESAYAQLKQQYEELKQAESEKTVRDEIKNMEPSARLATLYQYRTRLAELQNLSRKTENLRKDKIEQIENRIRQFEQLVEVLPERIEKAKKLSELQSQKDLLLRNLDQTQETPLHQRLTSILDRIKHLESFFESLRYLDFMPRRTPSDLDRISQQIDEVERRYSNILAQAQWDVLNQKRQEVAAIRQQAEQEAHLWLIDLITRYENGAKSSELLAIAQNPPEFLRDEDRDRLAQLIQTLQQKIKEDTLLQIEDLFRKLNADARRECLRRLQELAEEL